MIIVNGEKNYKKQSADTLIAIVKGMIFNDEIEKVGGLLSDGWIDVFTIEGLRDGTETSLESTAAGLTKKCIALNIALKL